MKLRPLKLPKSYEIAISPNEHFIAALGRNVACANLRTMKRVGSWHPLSHPSHASFSQSSARLAVKNTSGQIVVISAVEGRVLSPPPPKMHDEGAPVHFSGCDEYLVDGTWSGKLCMRDSESLRTVSEFSYPGEMIKEIMPSTDRLTWLVAHQPKVRPGQNYPDSPYFSLWRWPLSKPVQILPTNVDSLRAAALSPCGSYIALVGHRRDRKASFLSIMTTEGTLVRETPTTTGGTGSRTRWSADGRYLSTVQADGFAVFNADSLTKRASIRARYPSDLQFLSDGRIAVGTWESGTVMDLPGADA